MDEDEEDDVEVLSLAERMRARMQVSGWMNAWLLGLWRNEIRQALQQAPVLKLPLLCPVVGQVSPAKMDTQGSDDEDHHEDDVFASPVPQRSKAAAAKVCDTPSTEAQLASPH